MPSAYPAAIGRRLVTIPVTWLLFAVAVVLALPALLIAAAADLALRRRGGPTVRMVAFVVVFLWIEVTSQLRVLWSSVSQPFVRPSPTERNSHLMHWWVARLIRGAERVIGLRFSYDIADDLGPGPLLVFCQHVSIIDAVLPAYALGTARGWHLRYSLTRGLRFLPCIDIVGHRLPNHFVTRGSADNTAELRHMRTMVTDMEADELSAIFPGGGLFTPTGLERAVAKLTERGSPEAVVAAGYRHVMPPRPGGVKAYFGGAPTANVIVVGHVGFEPLASIRKLWAVLPLADPVEMKIWRYDRAEVPVGEDERMAWLYEKWWIMDDWIDDQLRARGAEEAVAA
jgi:Acyltransferase